MLKSKCPKYSSLRPMTTHTHTRPSNHGNDLLTSYMTSVQPSSVMHWNTVNIARPKLSKFVMPLLGPAQNLPPPHTQPWSRQVKPLPQGWGSSRENSPATSRRDMSVNTQVVTRHTERQADGEVDGRAGGRTGGGRQTEIRADIYTYSQHTEGRTSGWMEGRT